MTTAAALPEGQRVTGPADPAGAWMEEGEGLPGDTRPPGGAQPRDTSWFQTLRTLPPWCSLAPAGAVWLVCQLEALLHPVCSLLLLAGLLWVVLGHCVYSLRGRRQEAEPLWRTQQQQDVAENRNNLHSWSSPPETPVVHVPLTLALADSLLLCVLQEPLSNPDLPHIKALVSRLKSVGDTLEKTGAVSGATLEEEDRGSVVADRLKLICTYLQQRTASLRALVQAQGRFEACVQNALQGLDSVWAQLEELHTGVTLSKEGSRGRVAVASARTDVETIFAVMGQHRTKLELCQAYLKDSTQLLQELTWSHKHVSSKARFSGESVWPELLLQSNMEQFDKVQECFNAVKQQTSTFRAHLEGLGAAARSPDAGPPAHAKVTRSSSAPDDGHAARGDPSPPSPSPSPSTSPSTSPSPSVRSLGETLSRVPRSLRERSAQRVSSTLQRLRQSGRRK